GVYTNSFGQGLKTAADGTIVPDYAGTGSANNPARSDHTHANGVAIGGPYQPQGSYAAANHTHANDAGIGGPYQAEGNYAIQGHGHDVSEISGMPRLRAYGFLSTSPSLGNSWYAGAYSPELNDNGWTVRLSNSCPLNALILVTPRGGDDVVTSYTAIVRKEATGNTFEIETFANWPSSTGSTPMPVSCTFMVFYD
ncbi:MAG: hypothetical protein FJZ01_28525, partial [Candidatus Sericytochromatia bacterium]|nr:hypothetical protein [Candidatus Tanganyikabacteria bacterium]